MKTQRTRRESTITRDRQFHELYRRIRAELFFAKNDAFPLIIREGAGGALSITFDTVNIDRGLNKNKTMDVDKIVCCDKGNSNAAELMAAMNGGANNWMNNPFAYLIFIMFAERMVAV